MRMYRAKIVLYVTAAVIFLGATFGFTDEAGLEEKLKQLELRVETLEIKLVEQDKCMKDQNCCIEEQKQRIAEYESKLSQMDTQLHRQVGVPAFTETGFTIGAGATMVVQGTNNTNGTAQKNENRVDSSYSADITIEREIKEIGARAFMHLETGEGPGLEDELTLYSNVNRDGNTDTYLKIAELLYEQKLLDDKLLITFGKLDPTAYFDNNEAANDETTQFLGRIFRNNPTIEFPDNTAGIRLALVPIDWVEFNYGAFDANSDWEKIGDNLFNIGEINFKPRFFERDGNDRFYTWYNNSYHTKWLDTSKEKEKEAGYGFGLSFDQKASDTITLFSRYGWQDPNVYNPSVTTTAGELNYSLEHSWSGGLVIEGKPWGREQDMLALAVGQVIPSNDYKKGGLSRKAKTEGHFETYYSIHINDHLSISPDFQYIWSPFGQDVTDDTKDIFIYGIRTQIDF
jgi:uncharacterized coiled-coil protein SlyX